MQFKTLSAREKNICVHIQMLTGTNKANIDTIKPSANKQANASFLFKIILISLQWSELQNGVDGG